LKYLQPVAEKHWQWRWRFSRSRRDTAVQCRTWSTRYIFYQFRHFYCIYSNYSASLCVVHWQGQARGWARGGVKFFEADSAYRRRSNLSLLIVIRNIPFQYMMQLQP